MGTGTPSGERAFWAAERLCDQLRVCDVCWGVFTPRAANQKRCSPACAVKAEVRRRNKGKPALCDQRCVCDTCGSEYIPTSNNQKRCSPECNAVAQKIQCGASLIMLRDQRRVCDICGTEFTPQSNNHKWCSPMCAATAQKRLDAARKPWLCDQLYVCDVCGAEFTPKRGGQKRCSPECAVRAAELKRKRGIWLIYNRDGFRCAYCGRSAYEDEVKLHVDHIIPREAGGNSMLANLITTCARCNLEKHISRVLDEVGLLAEVALRNEMAGINPEWTIKLGGRGMQKHGIPRRSMSGTVNMS